jgi:hypothetical protein
MPKGLFKKNKIYLFSISFQNVLNVMSHPSGYLPLIWRLAKIVLGASGRLCSA